MRLQQRLLGLAACLVLLGILIGLPVALWNIGPSVLPQALPSWGQVWQSLTRADDGTLALRVIKALGWACWMVMAVLIAVEIITRAGRPAGRRPSVPALRTPQSAVRALVGTSLLLFTATSGVGMVQAALPTAQAASAAPASVAAPAVTTDASAPTRTASPDEHQRAQTPPVDTADTTSHTVRQGESLWSIAQDHLGEGIRYKEIRDLNRDTLGEDPGFLDPGTVLKIPVASAAENAHTVTVESGDTLWDIADSELGDASQYQVIAEANDQISDPDVIEPGMTLTIPQASEATTDEPQRQRADDRTQKPAPTPTSGQSDPEQATGDSRAHAAAPTASAEKNQTSTTRQEAPHGAPEAGAEDSVGGWMLAGLTGGGAVLAGGILMALYRRRRTQHRHRRAGRTIATPTPALGPVEKTVNAMGTVTAPTLERMDSALRRLATRHAQQGNAMPDLAAVELTRARIGLHLSSPASLAAPWEGSEDGLHWYLPSGENALEEAGEATSDRPAPYPLLVTLGATDTGETWLLNLEELALSITGDTTRGRDVARYLAAELAVNPWSHGVRVDLVGVAEEVAEMDADRIIIHTGAGDPAAEVLADAVTTVDRSGELGADVATARAHQAGADTWHARLLLVDAAADRPEALNQLLDLLATHAGHTGASVVVRGQDDEAADGLQLHVSSTGRITIPTVSLELAVVGLTSDEARGCAAILSQGEQLEDVPVPVREDATEGWRAFTDEAGALREEHVRQRTDETAGDEETTSVLESSDEEYLAVGATTPADLKAVAPQVPAHISQAVREADPSLDEDLDAWWSPDCPLPRLSLLGPVTARTRGSAVTKRKAYYTEMLAYLATRATGATPNELAEAFGITPAKTRDYVRIVRDWLGTNPNTGAPHLPDARKAPAAQARGQGVYEVLDVLVDADLFRRLRARGEAQGPAGIEDLDAALRLVNGRPFDALRPGGWYWLSEGDRLDQHMICAIVDVAHLVTTFALQAGDLKRARLAAETAALAAPEEEIPRLDLAAVADAEGHGSQADRILADEVFNRSDDQGAPPELPARTQQVVSGKDWAERARSAS
ncbi:LysM peptidoglycan-binding domain-containing protein [Janibacter alittae]|uniref:LysM peptidoglycan-binding domain-containing protein n=1 Tax=Janibacter alittae TaxID=3115209 RepID=A0ABZ2ML95_9MICO